MPGRVLIAVILRGARCGIRGPIVGPERMPRENGNEFHKNNNGGMIRGNQSNNPVIKNSRLDTPFKKKGCEECSYATNFRNNFKDS